MVGFGYWLLKPSEDLKIKKYYIRFDESVLGLNVDAAVKYRGINVGKVTALRISPKNSEQVEVLVSILKTTPIKENTVAKLTAQGITGLSYINLSMGDNDAPPLEVQDGEKYPVIKSIPSFFENIEQSLGTVSTNLSKTLVRTSELLDDENQKEVTKVLKKTASFMDKMDKLLNDKTIKHLQSSAKNLDSTMKNIDSVTAKIDNMLPKIEHFVDHSVSWEEKTSDAFASITKSYLGIKASMDEFRSAIANGDFNIKEITRDIVPTLNNTLIEMQSLMVKVETTLNKHERSPSDILFMQEKIKKGPGEI
ncbi:MAG: MCE family protein [Epsilonproteobacteria bacterium]|nr:MCE family protein [Campylobacterota bacterium]